MMMESVQKYFYNLRKRLLRRGHRFKKFYVLGSIGILLLLFSLFLFYINGVKPNTDIFLHSTESSNIYGNRNPKFAVDFGKRDTPDIQWVRFESDISKSNPFEKEKKGFWERVKNFFRPIRSYGVEMSIKGVKVSNVSELGEEERLKEVAEIMGEKEVRSSTELVDLGRVFGDDDIDGVSRKTVVNKEISKGIDLEYQILEGIGLKEEIIIRNLDSYSKECNDISNCVLPANEYVFDLVVDDGLVLKKGWFTFDDGSREVYYFEDKHGNYVSHFLRSFAIDNVGNKTYGVDFSIENVEENRYEIHLVLDADWLYSNERVFPIRIDPSIVHNSKANFDTGTYISSEYAQSVAGVELVGVEKPVIDENTVGYWSFDSGVNDSSGNNNHGVTQLNGMNYGIQSSNLTFLLNSYGGRDDNGDVDIECVGNDADCYIVDRNGLKFNTPTINSGVAITDEETGSGYIMYSPSLSTQGITGLETNNSDHFVAVRYNENSWQYNNDSTWTNFTPTSDNILVAEIVFSTKIRVLDIWPAMTEGRIGKGYDFDGVNDYVALSDSSIGNFGTGDFSLEAWFKLDFDANNYPTLLSKHTSTSPRNGYALLVDSELSNLVCFESWIDGTRKRVCTNQPVIAGQWYHVVTSRTDNTLRIYLNGALSNSETFDNVGTISNTETFKIGHFGANIRNPFKGVIDEVKISSIARTSDEIYKSYVYGKNEHSGKYVSAVLDSEIEIPKVKISSTVSGVSTGDGETPYSTTGLVAQWNFNETSGTVASSGGSCGSACNGTLTNFSDTTGQDKVTSSGWTYNNRRWGNGGLMFDGTDDYVKLSSSTPADVTGDISIKFWVNLNSTGYHTILNKSMQYSIQIQPDNTISWADSSDWNYDNFGYYDIGLKIGKWQHIAVTKSNGIVKIYLDGEEKVSKSFGTALTSSSNVLLFGCGSNSSTCTAGTYLDGTLDTIRIYNRALTSSEVLSNYNSNSIKYAIRGGNSNDPNDGTWSEWNDNSTKSTLKSFDSPNLYESNEDGLVGYWSMDEESGTTINDISGTGNNGTATGTSIVDGKYGKGRSFNGSSDYISADTNINLANSNFTVSQWIKRDVIGGTYNQSTFSLGSDGSTNNALFQRFNTDNTFSCGFFDNDLTTTTQYTDKDWHHWVCTFDATTKKRIIYRDGIIVAEDTSAFNFLGNSVMTLGNKSWSTGNDSFFGGVLDETKVYNKTLSANRILSDYLEGIGKRDTLTHSSSNIVSDIDDAGNPSYKSNRIGTTINDGLISYWKMDEESGTTVTDYMDVNHGTATGTTIVDGNYGKARSLNGTSDYITMSNNIHSENMTISIWIYPTSWTNQTVMSLFTSRTTTDNGLMLYVQNSSLYFAFGGGGTAWVTGYLPPLNTWTNITVARDSSGRYLYANGLLRASTVSAGSYIPTTSSTRLGADTMSNRYYYQGLLDETKVYDTAKTSQEIYEEYLSLKNTFERKNVGLVSYWKMDEESGTTVADYMDINHGTATGTTIVDGNYGKARSFNGTSNYITMSNNIHSENITISMWIYPTSWSNQSAISLFTSRTTTDNGLMLYVMQNSSLHFAFGDGGTAWNTGYQPPLNTWTNITVARDSSGRYLYANGLLRASTVSAGSYIPTTSSTRLGADTMSNRYYYQGLLDETKVYDTAKTSQEIYEEYLSLKNTFERKNVGLVSYWKMDEESGTTVADYMDINHGTATGTTIVDRNYGKARSFNGTSDYVTIPNSSSLDINGSGSQITINMWINIPAFSSNAYTLIYKSKDNSSGNCYGGSSCDNRQYVMFVLSTGKIGIRSTSVNNIGGSQTSLDSSSSIRQNTWTHITGVIDSPNGVMKIYIDGVEDATKTYSTTGIRQGSGDVSLGIAGGTLPLNGIIDEVKIYNVAKTSQEIYGEYLSSKNTFEKKDVGLVSYWDMDEQGGTTVADYINTNHGTATGTTIVDGRINKARSFNGTSSDYISIPNSSSLDINDIGSQLTISMWIKISSNPSNLYIPIFKSKDNASGDCYGTSCDNRQFVMFVLTTGKIGFRSTSVDRVGVGQTSLDSSSSLKSNTWTHVVGVIDSPNGVMKIYFDGVENASCAYSKSGIRQGSGDLLLGAANGGTLPFKGMLDEVKIYNKALSPSEVLTEYYESIDRVFYPKLTHLNHTLPKTNLSNKISLPVYIASDTVGEYISTTVGESAYANYQPDANTVGLWHLDEIDGNGPYIKDSSGYNNDGIPVGSTYISDGQIGGARRFNSDTNNEYISVKDSPSLNPTAVTLEAWINVNSFQVGNIAGKDNNSGYRMQLRGDTQDIGFYDRGSTNYVVSTSTIVLNKWYHVVGTGDASGLKLYINGQLVASNSTAYGSPVTTGNFLIANRPAGVPTVAAFDGLIDEVRISNIARTPDEIRQAYEVGLRTHNIEIEFGATLDSSNLISDSTDTSFTIDGTTKGMRDKGSNIYTGEKIIVREQNSTGEYIAQGIVTSVNKDTGAITVKEWESISTFPTGGFTTKANVFKWQKEYLPIKGRTLDTHLDQANLLTIRIENGYGGRNIWIDNLTTEEYTPTVSTETINLGDSYRFFQYKAVLTSADTNTSPIIQQIQLDYGSDGPTMEQIMRHGKWFNNGEKQPFWWAK